MRMLLERHTYAPELNRVIFVNSNFTQNGHICAAGAQSIREARDLLFKPAKRGLIITARKSYPSGFEHLDAVRCALFTFGRFRSAIKEMRAIKSSFIASSGAGTLLLDGRIMPTPKITFTLKLVG